MYILKKATDIGTTKRLLYNLRDKKGVTLTRKWDWRPTYNYDTKVINIPRGIKLPRSYAFHEGGHSIDKKFTKKFVSQGGLDSLDTLKSEISANKHGLKLIKKHSKRKNRKALITDYKDFSKNQFKSYTTSIPSNDFIPSGMNRITGKNWRTKRDSLISIREGLLLQSFSGKIPLYSANRILRKRWEKIVPSIKKDRKKAEHLYMKELTHTF